MQISYVIYCCKNGIVIIISGAQAFPVKDGYIKLFFFRIIIIIPELYEISGITILYFLMVPGII